MSRNRTIERDLDLLGRFFGDFDWQWADGGNFAARRLVNGLKKRTAKLRREAERRRATADRLAQALNELVALKAAKDSGFAGEITEAEYRRRKPLAWAQARDALDAAGAEQ